MTGLVGWWPLHEQAGSANDLSGNGNDGTVNAATQGVAGRGGLTAYSFDGNGDYVDTNWDGAEISGSTNRTYAWWMNPDNIGSGDDKVFISHGTESTGSRLTIRSDDTNNDNLRVEISGSNYKSNISISNNEWQHFAVVLDGNTIGDFILYKNGIAENSTGASSVNTGTVNDVWIGSSDHILPGTFDEYGGVMSDVRVYDRALSQAEIETLYEWGSVDTARPPDDSDGGVSYYELDGDATDSWGTNDGTINGATSTTDAVRGTAYSFDGIDDYIDTGNNFAALESSTYTVSYWLKSDSQGLFRGAVVQRDTGNNGFYSGIGNSTRTLFISQDTDGTVYQINTDNAFTVGDWYHYVVTFDANSGYIRGYINGVLFDEDTSGSGSPVDVTENCYIGANQDNTAAYTDGAIDNVRIYDRVLTQREISQLYRYGTLGRDMRKLTTENKL